MALHVAGHAHGREGVAAVVREGPGDVHLPVREFQDLRHRGAHRAFGLRARGPTALGAARLVRQCRAVQLAVGGHGHPLDDRDPARHLVGGEHPAQLLAQDHGIQHRAVLRGDPRDQIGHGIATPHVHGARGDTGQGLGGGLGRPGFHAHAADLQLPVAATAVDERLARFAAHEVTRAVHSPPRTRGIRNECGGCAPRHAHVAVREAVTGEVQLPRRARGDLPQGRVQHRGPRVAHGTAQARGIALPHRGTERVDGELRGSVQVITAHARLLSQQGPQLLRHGLAAEHHEPGMTVPVQQAVAEQLTGVGGRHVDHVDARAVVVRHELAGLQPQPVVDHVHLVPVQHPEQFLPGHVEGEVHGVRHAQLLAQARHGGREDLGGVVVVHRGQPAVAHEHALGRAGGTGGVNHVCGVVRVPGSAQQVGVHVGRGGGTVEHSAHRGVVEIDDRDPRAFALGHLAPVPAPDQAARVGIGEQLHRPLDRLVAVEREVGRTRAHDREDRHHVIRRAGQADAHHVTASQTVLGEQCREAMHALVECAGGQSLLPAHEAQGLR